VPVRLWFVAPFEGEDKLKADGPETMVAKLRTLDHALTPPAFFALTRQ
jgi:hypothetical protein